MSVAPPSSDRLRAALRDPAALVEDEAAARATYLLRSHVLERIAKAATSSSTQPLLVKGTALALTVYPKPWLREMSDIDVLVRESERERLLDALEQEGFARRAPLAGRIWSEAALGETPLYWRSGAVDWVVEVHRTLDKLVQRPIDEEEIFRRSRPAPDLPQLRVPGQEDHALLVALHLASSEFRHPTGLVDLELLLLGGIDIEVLERRARQWKLQTAMYVALEIMVALGAPSVSAELVARFEPSRLRLAAIARHYDTSSADPARFVARLGLPWAMRQTVLRDDLGGWLWGLTRYGAQRTLERSTAAFAPAGWLARRIRAGYKPPDGAEGG